MLLSGVTKTIDVLTKIINMSTERLEEWYAIYFPELKLEDKEKFIQAVLLLDKTHISMTELSKLVGQQKAEEVNEKAKTSLGADIKKEDLAECQAFASAITMLYRAKKQQEEYQQKLAKELCPNMCTVAGPEIAAKLVAHVGSLRRLAMMPSSTIQVIGAEKALFKHLKNRKIQPPKHGLLFQHASISGSPKQVRGKIARALANKITLAAKADAFTHRDIGVQLQKDFESRYNEIMDAYRREKQQ